jgi:hypothetical protein
MKNGLCCLVGRDRLSPDSNGYKNGMGSPPPEEGARVGEKGEALKVKQKRNIIKTKSKQVGIPPKLIIMKFLC